MATEFKMPQLGETVLEGTITRWLKKEGEQVAADEALVEVSTDKVDSELPAPAAGTIIKIHAQEGETVQVGHVIAEIGEAGEAAGGDGSAGDAAEPQAEKPTPAKGKGEQPSKQEQAETEQPPPEKPEEPQRPEEQERVAASTGASADGSAAKSKEAAKAPQKEQPQERAGAVAAPEATKEEPRRGILSPLVRKLAAEHNVDLGSIKGTGQGGRITKQDVLAASGGAQAPAAAAEGATQTAAARPTPATIAGGEEVIQVSHMRKAIAEHMVSSLRETARAWNAVEVDMTAVGRLRRKAGPAFKEKEGFSLTWMPFICKAVTQALQKFPQVNATWNGDGTITLKHYVNLGIAVALENGLIVPVIRGADAMNLVGLARAVRDLAVRARSKKLLPDDVQGGTYTITNPGPFGSVLSVPIINKGQSGILGVDAVVKRPVVVTDDYGNDSIAIREMVFLSMSWDHRVIDGAEAAQFLATLKELLQTADYSSDLAGYLPEA